MRKGNSVLIEGRIQSRSWDGPDGQKRYRTEIVAERVQFGPRGSVGGGGAPASGVSSSERESGSGKSAAESKGTGKEEKEIDAIQYPEEEIKPEDIPF